LEGIFDLKNEDIYQVNIDLFFRASHYSLRVRPSHYLLLWLLIHSQLNRIV